MKSPVLTSRCKPVRGYLPGGFVRQRGTPGQLQLAKAIARQFRNCVPMRDRWRVQTNVNGPGPNQRKVYVFITWYAGRLSKSEHEGEGASSYDSRANRAGANVTIDQDFNVAVSIYGEFPANYLDMSIENTASIWQ
jgi:hypothetical protein